MENLTQKIAVVIPSYKVTDHILGVIAKVPHFVTKIYVVDDCCPNGSGKLVLDECHDPRVEVLFHKVNQGVGGAVKTGYAKSIEEDMDIVVKCDGDGQMDPAQIETLIHPIVMGWTDYTKGNRFYFIESLLSMPKIRLLGNSALSFINKASSGYWNVMDPTNGFTAIHGSALRLLPLDKIANNYFFEHDMLFRLNIARGVVEDIPMHTFYGDEESSMSIGRVFRSFSWRLMRCIWKRLVYSYVIRDFNIGTIYLFSSLMLLISGTAYGAYNYLWYSSRSEFTPTGTIIIVLLALIVGFQLFLSFIQFDVGFIPKKPLQKSHLKAISPPALVEKNSNLNEIEV